MGVLSHLLGQAGGVGILTLLRPFNDSMLRSREPFRKSDQQVRQTCSLRR